MGYEYKHFKQAQMNARETKLQERTQPTIAGEVRVSGCLLISSLKFRTDIPKIIVSELASFINYFEIPDLRRPTIYRFFEDIRDSYVTTDFETIWQLSRIKSEEQKKSGHIIFMDMATKSFFVELLNAIIDANPQYAEFRIFLNSH